MSEHSSTPETLAFVLPRYFAGIAGGAETLVSALAQRLAMRGQSVEILTTCARDNRSWRNELAVGDSHEDGILVRRFPVDDRDLERWIPLQIRISEGLHLTIDEQLDWMQHSVNSTALYAQIARNRGSYRALFFGPYLFGTTFWGSQIVPDRSILIPCLHDEAYAYLDVTAAMFRGVRGCMFNAMFEGELARSIYGDLLGGEVGMGFDPPAASALRALTPYFEDRAPYLLYLGRKETGKNAQLLVDHFIALKTRAPESGIKLVVVGGGSFDDLHRPGVLERGDIIDLHHVSEVDKQRLIRHALVLCQPSTNESFSIVLMEAWMLGTPVLVHANCAVTRHHVVSSGGGLYFSDSDDFIAAVLELSTNQVLRQRLVVAGDRYVRNRYSWSAVLQRFDEVLAKIEGHSADAKLSPGVGL